MIGDNIRALRRERGMSQEQLAVGLHVVRQTISKWEKGLSVPDADMLVQLAALAVLYRNLALLTSPTDGNCRLGAIRVTTLFHVVLLLLCTAVAVLLGTGVLKLTPNSEKWLAAAILSVVILFSGAVSPKLPFNRHTGLRLPWTVRDRDTWDLAHRLLGIISPAAVVLYIAGLVAAPCFEVVTLAVMCLWLGVPSLLSLVYYTRKMRGRL